MSPRPSLFGLSLLGWIRLGLVGCAVALLGLNWAVRRVPTPTDPAEVDEVAVDAGPTGATEISGDPDEPSLVNDGWYIRNMATAHGAFVIEIEAENPTETETIARTLIEPIKHDYDEILVYVNQVGDDSDLPTRRMQWTTRDGYLELVYDQPEPAR